MFKPEPWGKNAETIKFKTMIGNLNGPQATRQSKAKKNKSKKSNEKQLKTPQGKGPLAPPKFEKNPQIPKQKAATPKIKTGRIEKKNAKLQKQQQKLKSTPAPAKAVNSTKNIFDKKPQIPTQKAATPKIKTGRIEKKNAKPQKQQQKLKSTPALAKAVNSTKNMSSSTSISAPVTTDFQSKLKETLQGGRFRYINEQLYTMNSQNADKLFREDESAFAAYHTGYRHQLQMWPIDPLKRIIKTIRRLPKALEIGDFGCGEGKLAQSVSNKVYSMDLVSSRDDIIACDMAKTPLQTESLDVAVYCLSLMGTNLGDYFVEANRLLKLGGQVYIAEIQSRFDNVRDFIKNVEAYGFELIKMDANVSIFYFFHFKKVRNVGKVAVLPDFSLKPCLYRKR